MSDLHKSDQILSKGHKMQDAEIKQNYQHTSAYDQENRLTKISKSNGIVNIIFAPSKKIVVIAAIIAVLLLIMIYSENSKITKIKEKTKLLSEQYAARSYQIQRLKTVISFYTIQHRIIPRRLNYSSVGIPIPGNVFNSTKVKIQDLLEFDKVVNELFKPYNDTDCEYVRYGNQEQDGGYVVCNNFIAQTQALINIGISGARQDSLGCQLSSKFKLPNYQYDCTDNGEPVCPTNNNGNHFLQVCIGDQKERVNGYVFHPLKDIIKDRRLTKKHITLKLDAEGGEYGGLKYFPMEDLDYIDQILLQLHFGGIGPWGYSHYPEYWGHLDIFRSLMEKFVNVNYHPNNIICYPLEYAHKRGLKASAYQLTLVNKKLIKLKSNSRSFADHPTNRDSSSGFRKCPLP